MAKIIDQYGNPISPADLTQPQTARIAALQNPLIESHLDGITPARAARILRNADQGDLTAQAQLFDDMVDRDAHLRCEYDKRAAAITGLDWSIEPPTNANAAEKAAAAWCEEILRDAVDDLEDVLIAMMDGVGHGFAPIELEWYLDGGERLPRFHPRPQTWFRTDMTRRELRLNDGSGDGAIPTPMGWIMHQHRKVKTGYLGRAGLFRAVLWPFLYKAYSIGDFAEFLEIYGLPIIVGKYMPGASAEEKSSLMRAVTALGRDARAIMPDGMQLEIEKITAGGAGDGNHLAMVAWADGAQSKAILGQVLSAEAKATGMGSGVADLHAEVRGDIRKSDARQIAGTLTRDLIYPLIALNKPGIDGQRRCPRWVFDTGEAEDLKLYAEALPTLAAGGARIPVSWVHEKLRIPQADEKEPVFGATPNVAVATPEVAPAALAALAARQAEPDTPALQEDGLHPVDALLAVAMADWREDLTPLVDPIQAAAEAAIANGETAEQFLARLPGLLATMNADALAERLTRAAFAARLGVQAEPKAG